MWDGDNGGFDQTMPFLGRAASAESEAPVDEIGERDGFVVGCADADQPGDWRARFGKQGDAEGAGFGGTKSLQVESKDGDRETGGTKQAMERALVHLEISKKRRGRPRVPEQEFSPRMAKPTRG